MSPRPIRPVVESDDARHGETRDMAGLHVTARRYNVHTGLLDDDAADSGSDNDLDYPSLWWVADDALPQS